MDARQNIRRLSQDELLAQLSALGEPPFRTRQIWQWLWQKNAASFHEMTNLSKELREKINAHFILPKLQSPLIQRSNDGTMKYGFQLSDGEMVEGVLIPQEKRMTGCISSQVGCSLSCTFCATGMLARKRNLFWDEIYDQVAILHQAALESYGLPLTNIVFMGMGEPLLNYRQVSKAIEMIISPDGLGMAPKRITLSTAGIAKMIHKLAEEKVAFNLALSLHAADNEKRNQIMPINESNSLEALSAALQHFHQQTQLRITFEYVMLKNFNDTLQDAHLLWEFSKIIPCKINLIEYNPIGNGLFERSSGNATHRFKDYLENKGAIVNIRRSRGADIDAACGQLANKNNDE